MNREIGRVIKIIAFNPEGIKFLFLHKNFTLCLKYIKLKSQNFWSSFKGLIEIIFETVQKWYWNLFCCDVWIYVIDVKLS